MKNATGIYTKRKGAVQLGNFIKIDRKILNWEWWHDKNTSRLFFYMILRANWKDGNFEGNIIPRGSFVSSISKLAVETNLSEREVRTAIKHLKSTCEVTVKTTNKYSVFTVNNYDLYQLCDMQCDNQVTSKRQASDRQVTTIEEYKEYKEDKEYITVTNVTVRQTETVQRVVDEWNSLKEYGIKPISKLACGSKRYQSLCARINQYGIDDVLKAIDNIRHSEFLQGKSSKRPWVITFDWFVLPNNFPKVLEGQYNDKAKEVNNSYESESSLKLW